MSTPNRPDHATDRAPEARLLIVDDEPNIVELLSASLRFSGFEVHTATNGTQALHQVAALAPDLVVLDVMMPGLDGFEVVRRMRQDGHLCPVLFLTARDAVEDRVTGLTLGADDYVTKPFSLGEVLARIRAILRRAGLAPQPGTERMVLADIELDEDAHEVFKAGQPVDLSPTEFKLLRFLMANQGRVMSKAQILDHVWHYDFGGEATVVESYISYLRRKVDTTEPRLLHTVRGVGLRPARAAGVLMPGRVAARWRATPLRSRLVGLLLVLVAAALLARRCGHGCRPARVPVQPGRPQPRRLGPPDRQYAVATPPGRRVAALPGPGRSVAM